jgi:hypothetical protein
MTLGVASAQYIHPRPLLNKNRNTGKLNEKKIYIGRKY